MMTPCKNGHSELWEPFLEWSCVASHALRVNPPRLAQSSIPTQEQTGLRSPKTLSTPPRDGCV
jgi:hypothetical protein